MQVPEEHGEWEVAELNDALVAYEIAAATERKERDRLIAAWRDRLHNYLRQVGQGDLREVHVVIDSMDNFLNRAGGRRK